MPISKDEFRRILSHFATGVTIVTVAKDNGQVHGMAANAFTAVSLEPRLILICVDRRARTLPLLHRRGRFGINMLSEEQQVPAKYYADARHDHENIEHLGLRYHSTERGTPLLEPCLAQLECRVVFSQEAGDHTLFIAEVEQGRVREGRPLVFYQSKFCRLESGH